MVPAGSRRQKLAPAQTSSARDCRPPAPGACRRRGSRRQGRACRGDFATREILEEILEDEDRHIDEIEEMQDQIGHMTLPLFLTTKV
jgi:hypothetical protein